MECADQGSLSEFLKREKKLIWETLLYITLDIAKGLSCMHKEQILHDNSVSGYFGMSNGLIFH
jgi:serine/threonine protein kinase